MPSMKKEIEKNRKKRSPVFFHERKKNKPTVKEAMAMAPNKKVFMRL